MDDKISNTWEFSKSAFQGLFPGAVGGTCCVLVGHPWDLVKVRMQTTPAQVILDSRVACAAVVEEVGTFNIIRSIVVQEGAAGLYRGVFPPLASVVPAFAVTFLANDFAQNMILQHWSHKIETHSTCQSRLTIEQYCVAGAFTAIPATAILAPSERIKCLLQIQAYGESAQSGPRAESRRMWKCIHSLYANGGLRSIYKGTGATLLRDIPGNAAFFGAYELTRTTLAEDEGLDDPSQLSAAKTLFAGGIAGSTNWLVALPMDVIKSRYQTAPEGMYNSLFEVFQRLLKEEGVQGLYRGLTPALLRAFPANAACFLGVEMSRKLFI